MGGRQSRRGKQQAWWRQVCVAKASVGGEAKARWLLFQKDLETDSAYVCVPSVMRVKDQRASLMYLKKPTLTLPGP